MESESLVRAKVDAILAGDTDTLTAPGMIARATWADAWRSAGHRETAPWHFVDQELGHPDLSSGCFGRPALSGAVASAGPAQDCVVDKIDEFTAELASPSTTPAERLLALKYVLHFVGDVHQPLHASDNQDRGANCVRIALGGPATSNLHSFWDTAVLAPLGADPVVAAAVTPAGFYDAVVAVPNQKAALEAWGARSNLFGEKFAQLGTDEAWCAKAWRRLVWWFANPVATPPR